MQDCILVDIDGTLAEISHRRKYLLQQPKNWAMFFRKDLLMRDGLIEPVARLVLSMAVEHNIIYVTGRPSDLKDVTIDWLIEHELWIAPNLLFMRRAGDKRPDYEVKREILYQLKDEGWNPWLSIDDRNSVVDMWRSEGLTCLQAAEGDF